MNRKDVFKAKCDIKVLSHARNVSQVAVFNGVISEKGYTSMFSAYLGLQGRATPCRYIVSVGKGFINPLQFSLKTQSCTITSERDGYCINVWTV